MMREHVTKTRAALVMTLGLLSWGCGAAMAPKELQNARDAYAQAQQGLANELAPAQLESARQVLERAERAFNSDGDDIRTRDLAYLAARSVQLAVLHAQFEQATRQWSQASTERQRLTEQRLLTAEEQLTERERQLKDETSLRIAAEKKAAEALASLRELASVKEESRGTVVTLPGSLLFASGQFTLLPIARTKLAEVAKALEEAGFKSIVVEGHTDSRGSDTSNLSLSQSRAEAVRTHLISEGIDAQKISALGKGETTPVADNESAEGRANNRRVELIVTPES